MKGKLKLVILTPEKKLLDAPDVSWIKLSLADGGTIGILPNHAPLIAKSISGPLHYRDEKGSHELEIQPGILNIDSERVAILTSGLVQTGQPTYGDQVILFDRLVESLNVQLGLSSGP